MQSLTLTAKELLRKLSTERDCIVLDVRTDEEYADGRIPNAIHIPLHDLAERAPSVLPEQNRPIVVYCAHGIRSAQALRWLSHVGYQSVSHLESGFVEWVELGLPVDAPELEGCRTLHEERYSRQLLLENVGPSGQARLAQSRVLLVGVGGLGSPAAMYLAGAGVGTLGLVDSDTVALSNLHRQILFSTKQIGTHKVESAKQRIEAINPDVRVVTFAERFSVANARRILATGWDVILDGSDNFATRYAINDAAVEQGITVCHGAVDRFAGQITTFLGDCGPCYRCLFPTEPAKGALGSCVERGVLGVLPGLVGVLQATEALKILLTLGASLSGRLLTYDALEMSFRELRFERDPNCRVCRARPSV